MFFYMPNLCQLAHRHIAQLLQPGDWAIDGTVGNGHDTCFLAKQVGVSGRVIGFDVQNKALESAQKRLLEAGLARQVTLLLKGHEYLAASIPQDWVSQVRVVMFNLGYLPGGDKSLVSRADSTIQALDQALRVLANPGLLSVLCYRGHPGGNEEYLRVVDWVNGLDSDLYSIVRVPAKQDDDRAPVLFSVEACL